MPPGWLDGLDASALDRFERLASPSPTGAAREPQRLRDPRRYRVPVTVITTTQTIDQVRERVATGDPLFTDLGKIDSVDYVSLPTGHYPMMSRSAELAAAILAVS